MMVGPTALKPAGSVGMDTDAAVTAARRSLPSNLSPTEAPARLWRRKRQVGLIGACRPPRSEPPHGYWVRPSSSNPIRYRPYVRQPAFVASTRLSW
jgi:hypothetical protein